MGFPQPDRGFSACVFMSSASILCINCVLPHQHMTAAKPDLGLEENRVVANGIRLGDNEASNKNTERKI